jgi:uncharacterized protein YxjI
MQYPLTLSFKIMAIARQLSVTEATGQLAMYVKMKILKLKEEVLVFSDKERTQKLFTIKADRVIDFSAKYNFSDAAGTPLGAVKRRGMKSLWKSHYDIFESGEEAVMTIQEENPWVKVMDAIFQSIPVVGTFAGYVFHPVYIVADTAGKTLMKLKKQPAFFEGKFEIEKVEEIDAQTETRILLSLMMMLLLERSRG